MNSSPYTHILGCLLPLLLAPTAAHADQWKITKGKGYVICDAINERLNNRYWTRAQSLTDAAEVVDTYPGWKEPPWEDIDPQQHMDLLLKLIRYEDNGADVYFGHKPRRFGGPDPQYTDGLNEKLKNALRLGVRIQVWRTHLINWLDNHQVLHDNQTVVQVSYRQQSINKLEAERLGLPVRQWLARTFIVTDDLKGPDARVEDGIARALMSSKVLLFDGIPHFVGGYLGYSYAVNIDRDFGGGPRGNGFCLIEFNESKVRK